MSEPVVPVRRSWDERYRSGEHANARPLEFISGLQVEGDLRMALDLACGAGRHALALARNGWEVTAVDGSRVALEILEKAAADESLAVHCVLADLEKGEFDIGESRWDLVVVAYYLDRTLFPAIQHGLKLGGRAAFVSPREDERPGVRPMSPAFLMGRGELVRHFPATNWVVEHAAEIEPALPERARTELVVRRVR